MTKFEIFFLENIELKEKNKNLKEQIKNLKKELKSLKKIFEDYNKHVNENMISKYECFQEELKKKKNMQLERYIFKGYQNAFKEKFKIKEINPENKYEIYFSCISNPGDIISVKNPKNISKKPFNGNYIFYTVIGFISKYKCIKIGISTDPIARINSKAFEEYKLKNISFLYIFPFLDSLYEEDLKKKWENFLIENYIEKDFYKYLDRKSKEIFVINEEIIKHYKENWNIDL